MLRNNKEDGTILSYKDKNISISRNGQSRLGVVTLLGNVRIIDMTADEASTLKYADEDLETADKNHKPNSSLIPEYLLKNKKILRELASINFTEMIDKLNLNAPLSYENTIVMDSLGYVQSEEEKQKSITLIPKEAFYLENWNLDEFAMDIRSFFINYYKIKEDNESSMNISIFEKDGEHHLILTGYRGKELDGFMHVPPSSTTYRRVVNKELINKNNIKRFVVATYKTGSRKKAEEILRLLKNKVVTAFIHLMEVKDKYDEEGKSMYYHFNLEQKNNKVREIYAPYDDVKEALRHLLLPLDKMFEKKVKHAEDTIQFAYRNGLSIKDNAEVHKDNKYVVKVDVKSFFDSCNWNLAKKYLGHLFRRSNLSVKEIDTFLDNLKDCFINKETNGLYMGSPVSGVLSNLIMRPVASYLYNIFNDKNIKVSIYADDITVSSNKPLSRKYVEETINYVFEFYDLPFILKDEKTKSLKNNGRRITGVRINHKDEMTVDRRNYRLMRSMLANMSKGIQPTMKKSEIQGRLNYYLFIDETGKFRSLAEKYFDVLKANHIDVSLKGQVTFDRYMDM